MKGLQHSIASVLLVASAALCAAAEGMSGALLVYSKGFATAAGAAWSLTNFDVIRGRRFLGQPGNQTATLSLSNLLPHAALRVVCDLFIIRLCDGSGSNFDLRHHSERPLLPRPSLDRRSNACPISSSPSMLQQIFRARPGKGKLGDLRGLLLL